MKLLVLLVSLIIMSGCATITRGTSDTLVIETEPSNASASLSNGLQCKTPCALRMSRKDNVIIKIEKDGFIPIDVVVAPQISGAGSAGMAGNLLFGGLIGAAVDAGSGAMLNLVPNPVKVTLEKKPIPNPVIEQIQEPKAHKPDIDELAAKKEVISDKIE